MPASSTATGTAGSIARDSEFIYVATGQNNWKRAAISSWPWPVTSNLMFLGRAADANTLTLSGSNVTQWRDANGGSLVLAADAGNVTVNSTGINSQPALAFGGSASLSMAVQSSWSRSAPFSVAMILLPTATTTTLNAMRIGVFGGITAGEFAAGLTLREYQDPASGSGGYYFGGFATRSFQADFSPYVRGSSLSQTVKLMTYVFNGTNAYLYENGSLASATSTNSGIISNLNPSSTATAYLSVGGQKIAGGSPVLFGQFLLSDIALYSTALTIGQVSTLATYATSTYATA
ncbi:MAG: hypothetical protein EBR82_25155 [Caulobacteraceae bacterium]|nr:hypothetical protein [Caulobacteraceae bacterium]